MRHRDTDIESLEQLLGTAKADYRMLRHRGDLPKAKARTQNTPPLRHAAVAVAALVALGAVLMMTLDGSGDPRHGISRLSMPAAGPSPLSLRPDTSTRVRLSLDRSALPVRSTLPRRPTRSKG